MKDKEREKELKNAAEKFLDLLYGYDYIGKDAYFKKDGVSFLYKGNPLYDRSDYRVLPKRKYIWLDTPSLRLGITKEGQLFKPKKYWSFDCLLGVDINSALDPKLWGKKIFRIHTSTKRGLGMRHESAVIEYHNLHFRLPNSRQNRLKVT